MMAEDEQILICQDKFITYLCIGANRRINKFVVLKKNTESFIQKIICFCWNQMGKPFFLHLQNKSPISARREQV